MGTHHSGTGQAPTPSNAPGPRQAAARHRKKRALYTATAAGAALLVATAATAALLSTGAQPGQATQAATVPEAATDPLHTGPDHNSDTDDTGRTEDSTHEPATTTAQGPAVTEEPDQDTTEPNDPGGSGGPPTGPGGTCQASFYGDGFDGSTTANGETFDTYAMTAAHKTLPFDTMVEVTNPSNGQSATVRINDRGPYIDGRCLDLSTAAFDEVIGTGSGVGTVDWQVLQ